MGKAAYAVILLASGCASGARQVETRGGSVALADVHGKFPGIVSVGLYFYPGKFEIPLHLEEGLWRGTLSGQQVSGMARERYGFQVFRCKLTVITRGPSGETYSSTQDLTIELRT